MKTKLSPFIVFIILLTLLLTACSGEQAAEVPAPTTAPETASTQADTNAPTEAPAPTPTEPPSPTDVPTPTEEPAPTLDLPAGWYLYTNANAIRDIVVHEGIAYAATLGGVVAWDLSTGAYTKHTTMDGLKHISTYAVTVCGLPETRIVVGTEKGLSLLDPATGTWDNTPLTPEGEFVNEADIDRLYCDQANNRLLIGYSGLGILDLATGEFTQYTDDEGLSWNGISDIAAPDDIWVASGYNGISQIAASGVNVFNEAGGMPSERALSIANAPDGTLWIGTSKGLVKYQGSTWTLYDSAAGLFGEISEIEIAEDGTVWIGSAPIGTGRVCQFDPATATCLALYEDPNGQPIVALALDEQGRAVFGTHKEVYIFDGTTATRLAIETDQLVSNFVDSFNTDANGMLWIGTDAGFHRVDPANPDAVWETFQSEFYTGDPNSPGGNWSQAISTAPNGDVLVAITNGDASLYSNGQWTVFEDVYSYETAAIDSAGNYWLGDDSDGILVLDAAGNTVMTLTDADGLPNINIRSLMADGDTMWIGTIDGLAKYEGGTLSIIFGKDDPALPDDNVSHLRKDLEGNLLIGTISGITRYDGTTATILTDLGEVGFFLSLSGFAVAPDGTLWVGTTDGLLYSTDDGTTWTRLTTEDGLPTNLINTVHVDLFGTVWVGGGYTFGGGGLLRIVP